MTKAIYGLIIPNTFKAGILEGYITAAIRPGSYDYRVGSALLIAVNPIFESWTVLANLTKVRICAISELVAAEAKAAGYDNLDDLLKALYTQYPNLTSNSVVTVIHWNNVRSHLLEQHMADIAAMVADLVSAFAPKKPLAK